MSMFAYYIYIPLGIVLPMTILLSDARSAMYGLRRGGIGLAKFGIGQSQPSGAPSLPAQCSAIHKCWKCMHAMPAVRQHRQSGHAKVHVLLFVALCDDEDCMYTMYRI